MRLWWRARPRAEDASEGRDRHEHQERRAAPEPVEEDVRRLSLRAGGNVVTPLSPGPERLGCRRELSTAGYYRHHDTHDSVR
jgi:hypothetical protein